MRTNLHPNYTAKLPKNSESWRVNAIYQTSKEICGFSPRALNGWRLITKPNAGRAGLGIQKRNKIRDRHGYSRGMRQTVARGTRYLPAMFNNQKQYWEQLGDNLQWKNLRRTLLDQTASIIGRWREICEDWPVNFSFLAHGKSYSTLPPGSSEEPTA